MYISRYPSVNLKETLALMMEAALWCILKIITLLLKAVTFSMMKRNSLEGLYLSIPITSMYLSRKTHLCPRLLTMAEQWLSRLPMKMLPYPIATLHVVQLETVEEGLERGNRKFILRDLNIADNNALSGGGILVFEENYNLLLSAVTLTGNTATG